jgi:hypothetical protein
MHFRYALVWRAREGKSSFFPGIPGSRQKEVLWPYYIAVAPDWTVIATPLPPASEFG